ncbi:hypothetical protein [Williamsia sp.]|uniref:hypothetical protein n=1 Tax=Williamsia sp. TaxID=1872085 RepID=UPI002F93A57A
MSDDQSVLAELGISVDDFDAPAQAWTAALDATFDPATGPVAGDVVPVMDDEPHLADDEPHLADGDIDLADDDIDLGEDDASLLDMREANSHRGSEPDDDSDGDIDTSVGDGGAAAGAIRLDDDAIPDLGFDSDDDDSSRFDI